MKNVYFTMTAAILVTVLLITGCVQNQTTTPNAQKGPSAEGAKYVLADEPEGAKDVAQAREAAQDEGDVVVVGRIGGSTNPWVEGMAAFTIVDRSLKACSDIEGDKCTTPWDYCCEPASNLKASSALIKFVDDEGHPVKSDARELLGLEELQTVVIRGKAQRDDSGNLTVLAEGIHVRP